MICDDKKDFLIIDDEPDMCWALTEILKQNGYASTTAYNGAESLDILMGSSFRIVFLDAKLPDTEGVELALLIRRKHPLSHIVMISGYFYRDGIEVQEALKDGLIDEFISKPFNNDDIKRVIELLNSSNECNTLAGKGP